MKRGGGDKGSVGAAFGHKEHAKLELETVSLYARTRLTRLLRRTATVDHPDDESHMVEIARLNRIVNVANTEMGRPVMLLEGGDWDYHVSEYAWNYGELELILRRPATPQLAQIIADLVDLGALAESDVNAILAEEGAGFRISVKGRTAGIELLDMSELPDGKVADTEHPNVRALIDRMDKAVAEEDWPLVIHTAASVVETLAKQMVPDPNAQGRSLGGWFDKFRNHARAAPQLLDYMQALFNRRNTEPLAGHGSTVAPNTTRAEALEIRELTVAFVRIERVLSEAGEAMAGSERRKSVNERFARRSKSKQPKSPHDGGKKQGPKRKKDR